MTILFISLGVSALAMFLLYLCMDSPTYLYEYIELCLICLIPILNAICVLMCVIDLIHNSTAWDRFITGWKNILNKQIK